MNPHLQQILAEGKFVDDSGREVALHSHVSPAECEFLQGIVREIKAERALEIGLAYGISAMAICDALNRSPQARHIVVDPAQTEYWKGLGLANIKRCGFGDLVEFFEAPSHQALPQLEARGDRVDFAFIDGMHTFDHTLVDFFYVDRLLRVGGVVAIDDADFAAVRKVCRYVLSNRSYRVFRCLGEPDGGRETKHRIASRVAGMIPAAERIFAAEVVEPDHTLGMVLGSRCVALIKEDDDHRQWNFHRRF